MAEQREGFAVDVGSKLLFGAIMLMVFGVIALVLMPIGALLGPAAPDQPFIARLIGGLMPGLIVVVISVVLGALGGLLLGYAAKHGNYP